MSEVAYCGSSEPHAEHEVGGVGRMGPFTTTCEGVQARERTAAEVTAARPEMGELVAGQKVMVRRSPSDMRGRPDSDRYIPAVVVKAARVWVELARADLSGNQLGYRVWKMRRDTQDEGTQYSRGNSSFATLDQHAYDQAQHWARGVLGDNGIRIDHSSPWRGREIELADLIRRASSPVKGGGS